MDQHIGALKTAGVEGSRLNRCHRRDPYFRLEPRRLTSEGADQSVQCCELHLHGVASGWEGLVDRGPAAARADSRTCCRKGMTDHVEN
jgi:hypothetical protein